MTIGVAGLGRMGAAITKRLIDVGHDVVVWNRTVGRTKAAQDAGATLAATPTELAGRCETIITILTDAAAIDSVYHVKDGLLAGEVTGKLFIDMSTVRPETEAALAATVSAKDAAFVECPVGGTVGPALNGKLFGLAGGTPADFERARPLLEQLCRRVTLAGPVGSGSSLKLAVNLPLNVFWQAFGESFALCRHLGLDTNMLVELFSETSGGPNVLRARGGAVALALQGKEPGSATFDCDSMRKDLRTMVAEAKSRGFDLPLAETTLEVFDEASRQGWGGRDCVEMPAYWSNSHHK